MGLSTTPDNLSASPGQFVRYPRIFCPLPPDNLSATPGQNVLLTNPYN